MTAVKDNARKQFAETADTTRGVVCHDASALAEAAAKEHDGSRTEAVMEAVKGAVQDVTAGASHLVSQGRDAAQQWAGAASDAACQAKDTAQQWAGAAADAAGHAKDKAVEMAGDFGQDMTRMIRRYPLQAVLLGLGVGFLLARVTRQS